MPTTSAAASPVTVGLDLILEALGRFGNDS
jgi:hypothetical protein